VRAIRTDCDQDVVLFEVEQVGGIACHTGRHSCFFLELRDGNWVEYRSGSEGSEVDLRQMTD